MDLKSAYKQFGVRGEDRERVRVATCHPTTEQFILLMVNTLPFGATGSVSGFLRASMFLWFLGTVGLKLAWTSFYDDYTMVSRADCANNAAWSAECLLDLLGIVFAKEAKRRLALTKCLALWESSSTALAFVRSLFQFAIRSLGGAS